MASVQELLAAAQAQQSPFISLLEGLTQGGMQGYQEAPARRKAALDLQREQAAMQADQEAQQRAAENDRLLRTQLAGAAEQHTQGALAAASAPRNPTLPALKLAAATIDPKTQLLKPEFKTTEAPPKAYQPFDYQAADGRTRRGSYDPNTGTPVISPSDPLAPARAGAEAERQPSQSEEAARQFADKARQAHGVLQGLEGKGFQPSSTGNLMQAVLPTPLQNSDYQSLDQARRQFINAILRRESGAAISAGEYDSYTRQYFPMPGDSPDVLRQKENARELAIKGLETEGKRVPSSLPSGAAAAAAAPIKVGRFTVEAL
jgi:hypothetical protein